MDEQDMLIEPVHDTLMELELGFMNEHDVTNGELNFVMHLPEGFVEMVNNFGSVGGPKAPINVRYRCVGGGGCGVKVLWEMVSEVGSSECSCVDYFVVYCREKMEVANEYSPGYVEVGRLTMTPTVGKLTCDVNLTDEYKGKTVQYLVQAVDKGGRKSALSCGSVEGKDDCVFMTLPDIMGVSCVYEKEFDENGVLYYIGTNGKTEAYQNPHTSGKVVASMSSVVGGFGSPDRFVAHRVVQGNQYNHTDNYPNSWMSVDLGVNRKVLVTGYCLRNDGNTGHALRNWSLQGKSGDGDEWVELKRHDNDASLATTNFSVAYWPLVGENVTKTAYRQFRIIQHGRNACGNDYLV
jgi:hypothetical protein